MARFLNNLPLVSEFVRQGALAIAKAVRLTTFGELGAMSWGRGSSGWSGPFRTFPDSFELHAKNRNRLLRRLRRLTGRVLTHSYSSPPI